MAFFLFLFAFVVYNANLRSITSFDTYATRLIPISIIKEGSWYLDRFPFMHHYPRWWSSYRQHDPNEIPYYLIRTRGHYVSTYPVMPAILSVPVYALPVLVGLTDLPISLGGVTGTEAVATFLAKLSASVAVALSVAVVYLMLLRVASQRAALWTALIYAFATSSWSVSSQGLWQTAMSQPLLAVALYLLVTGREDSRHVGYAGIPLALAVACRASMLVFAGVLGLYVLLYERKAFFAFMVFPVVLGALLATYNVYYFGTPFYSGPGKFFGAPSAEALLGLLISPSRGIFIYSPILALAFVELGLVLRGRVDPLLCFSGLAVLVTILVYSAWNLWDAAFSYSYRYLVDLLPALSLFLAKALDRMRLDRWKMAAFTGAVAFSIFAQVIGAFFYPCGWYETPTEAWKDRHRFWDWRDPEMLRCLRAGPVLPDGLRLLETLGGRGRR